MQSGPRKMKHQTFGAFSGFFSAVSLKAFGVWLFCPNPEAVLLVIGIKETDWSP